VGIGPPHFFMYSIAIGITSAIAYLAVIAALWVL
jgi:hypothetical protein